MLNKVILGPEILSVAVTVNPDCSEKQYHLLGTFGATSVGSNDCRGQENGTSDVVSPGGSAIFTVKADSVALESDEGYCYTVSSNGKTGEWHENPLTSSIIMLLLHFSQ